MHGRAACSDLRAVERLEAAGGQCGQSNDAGEADQPGALARR